MHIKNQTPNVASLSENVVQGKVEYTLDYGNLKKGQNTQLELLIPNAIHDFTKVGCPSCTKAKSTQIGNDISLEISYDSKIIGGIQKTVIVTLKNKTNIIFKLRGNVVQ